MILIWCIWIYLLVWQISDGEIHRNIFCPCALKGEMRETRTEMTSAHKPDKMPIETYEHKDKQRLNNPPVGLVTPETDREEGSRSYSHDPHLDPQLVWAGKAEHTSFLVPTVSLHVHERIDPRTIIAAVRRRSGLAAKQASLFD